MGGTPLLQKTVLPGPPVSCQEMPARSSAAGKLGLDKASMRRGFCLEAAEEGGGPGAQLSAGGARWVVGRVVTASEKAVPPPQGPVVDGSSQLAGDGGSVSPERGLRGPRQTD